MYVFKFNLFIISALFVTAFSINGSHQVKRQKNLFLPVNLPSTSSLYLFNSVWKEHNDVEVDNNSCDVNYDFIPKIKFEPVFVNQDLQTSLNYEGINSDTPLPEFSDLVCKHITENNLNQVWGAFVDECAKYYFSSFPMIQNSSEYQTIGRKMYHEYPAIEHEGKEPWSYFCKCLSQKIRHIKWKIKRKTLGLKYPRRNKRQGVQKTKQPFNPDKRPRRKKMLFQKLSKHVDHRYTISKQYKALLRELIQGWSAKTLSEDRIKDILKSTFKGRRTWLATNSSAKMSAVMESYPCFALGKYVMHDFLLITEKENTLEMCQRLESLFTAVGNIMEPSLDNIGLLESIKILQHIEELTAFSKNKGSLWKSIIVHSMNTPEDEILKYVETNPNSPPQLFIFSDEQNITKAYVGGDQRLIDTEASSLVDALILFIATYYTFSIEFPRYFSQILGILKTFVVGDSYDGIKSSKYTLFVKRITKDCPSEGKL